MGDVNRNWTATWAKIKCKFAADSAQNGFLRQAKSEIFLQMRNVEKLVRALNVIQRSKNGTLTLRTFTP